MPLDRRSYAALHPLDTQQALNALVAWNGTHWTVTVNDDVLPDCCDTIEEAFTAAELEIARRHRTIPASAASSGSRAPRLEGRRPGAKLPHDMSELAVSADQKTASEFTVSERATRTMCDLSVCASLPDESHERVCRGSGGKAPG